MEVIVEWFFGLYGDVVDFYVSYVCVVEDVFFIYVFVVDFCFWKDFSDVVSIFFCVEVIFVVDFSVDIIFDYCWV